jgi:hypothetical protein
MRTFLRIIAAIITLIAVLLLPLSLFGYNVGQILFSPESMLNLVAGQVIGPSQTNPLAEILLQSLPPQWGIDDDSTLGRALSSAAEQAEIQSTLLPLELQVEYAAQGINSFYSWLEGSDPMPVLELDMQPLKSHIHQNAGGVVNSVLDLLPVCTAEESLALAATLIDAVLGGEAILDTLPSCLPTIIPVETVAPAAGELLRQQLANISDTIVLENLVQATPESMQELKGRLQLTKGALQWSWLPILFLLIIGALAGGQTQDGVPRWLGWSLVAAGVLTFLLTLIPPSGWLAVTVPQLAGWPLILQVPAVAIMGSLFEQAGQSTVWLAAVLVILGILFVILAIFLRRKEAKRLKF